MLNIAPLFKVSPANFKKVSETTVSFKKDNKRFKVSSHGKEIKNLSGWFKITDSLALPEAPMFWNISFQPDTWPHRAHTWSAWVPQSVESK